MLVRITGNVPLGVLPPILEFLGPPNPTLAALVSPFSSFSSSSSCSGPVSLKAASSIPEMLGSDGISVPWMGGKPGKGGDPSGNGSFLAPLSPRHG